jgi:predicted RNA binding protein YcfA (HicA-like mRNA interferase family)
MTNQKTISLRHYSFDDNTVIWYAELMKISEILSLLKRDVWYLVATRGSHRQFKHPVKTGRVTVAGKPSDELAPGTLNSILKQAKLKE